MPAWAKLLVDGMADVSERLHALEVSLFNQQARIANSRALEPEDALVPLKAETAGVNTPPAGFPATRIALMQLSGAALEDLEELYNLAPVGNVQQRRSVFAKFIGVIGV